jgi:hypothetical protein
MENTMRFLAVLYLTLSVTLTALQRVTEKAGGTMDGTNSSFTVSMLPYPDTVKVFWNGVRLLAPLDYNSSGRSILLTRAPGPNDLLLVDYEALMPNGARSLVSKLGASCLTPNSSTNRLQTSLCNGADSQKLTSTTLLDKYLIVVKASGLVLDLLNGSTADGTAIYAAPNSGATTQLFVPVSSDNDTYFQLKSVATNGQSCLTQSGTSVVLQVCSNSDSQKWQWQ